MRKLLALVASTSTALLLVAGLANVSSAANVSLIFKQQAPGSNLWDLSMDVPDPGVQIGAVAFSIVGGAGLDFTISAPATSVDPFPPVGFSVKDNTTIPGTMHIVLNVGTSGAIATGTVSGFLLGVLNSNGTISGSCGLPGQIPCDARFLPGIDDGGTIQDVNFASLPFDVRFVPEPSAMLLLGMGIAGLSLVRRKA